VRAECKRIFTFYIFEIYSYSNLNPLNKSEFIYILFIIINIVNDYIRGDHMAININSSTFTGIEGVIVSVEVDITRGLPGFNIVGLADISVKESKERVRSAILNSGFDFPVSRITINLAPADIKKEGSLLDLPIAIGILSATGQINQSFLEDFLFIGELSLSGELKRVRGALPIVIEGCNCAIDKFIVPMENASECVVINKASIYPFETLKEVIHFINYRDVLPYGCEKKRQRALTTELDLSEVAGQQSCKRALEVAAAGGHNVIMFGPPGSGKTMLAQRIPSILPDLNYEEALEVSRIYSVSGNLDLNNGLMTERPFRNPHHTSSKVALIGGGNNLMPGEVSLAHNGVLFLDEMLEFKKNILEVLRQPLEDRIINITRHSGSVRYPANFMLVGALNPCPCGYFGSSIKVCTCTDYERKRYISKLSGPLLDRVDIFTFAAALSYEEINCNTEGESSKDIRSRVENARKVQELRYKEHGLYCNTQLTPSLIKRYCKLDLSTSTVIEKIYNKYSLTTRAYSRILKVARTIADLNGRINIEQRDVIEALQYRKFINENII
jgi:magnesium chelatase family protein